MKKLILLFLLISSLATAQDIKKLFKFSTFYAAASGGYVTIRCGCVLCYEWIRNIDNTNSIVEGKYNKYWNREWYDFKCGVNYVIF